MPDSSPETLSALRDAMALVGDDAHRAIHLLRGAIDEAAARGDDEGGGVLAKHAGTICVGTGLLPEALAFYREASRALPSDPSIHFVLGDVHRRLGDAASARSAFMRCLVAAQACREQELVVFARRALAELGP